MRHGKKYQEAAKLVDSAKVYSLEEAVGLIKKTSPVKFDATVDVSFHFNVDPTKADQQIRGTLILPHGNGRTKRIVAVTTKVDEARAAGADFVGGKELLAKIRDESWFDYDVIVATPEMMGELGRMGRLLGPKGLMPNPKAGTVTTDIAKAIREIKLGKVEYRLDREANMALTIGKVSFPDADLVDNLNALVATLIKARPAAVKGTFIKSASLHTTMGPSVRFLAVQSKQRNA